MNRRGILGGLGLGGVAAAIGGPATGARAGINMGGVTQMVGQLNAGARVSPAEVARQEAHRAAYEKLWAVKRRADRRRELEITLTGGLPPHLAGMKSNAPWFTAQRAARFLEAQEFEREGAFQKLSRKIMGDF